MTGRASDPGEREVTRLVWAAGETRAKARPQIAVRAVREIMDWLGNRSGEGVLVGMADVRMLDGATLQRLARRIAQARKDETQQDVAEAREETKQEGARK
jgi:hypothetical protein